MMIAGNNESFDCIAYKRGVQERIADEIRGLTPTEEVEYFERAAENGPLGAWWRSVRSPRTPPRDE